MLTTIPYRLGIYQTRLAVTTCSKWMRAPSVSPTVLVPRRLSNCEGWFVGVVTCYFGFLLLIAFGCWRRTKKQRQPSDP